MTGPFVGASPFCSSCATERAEVNPAVQIAIVSKWVSSSGIGTTQSAGTRTYSAEPPSFATPRPKPVDLDTPIGRLSRMNAMQQQEMTKAGRSTIETK